MPLERVGTAMTEQRHGLDSVIRPHPSHEADEAAFQADTLSADAASPSHLAATVYEGVRAKIVQLQVSHLRAASVSFDCMVRV
jgi:hypothetical protein